MLHMFLTSQLNNAELHRLSGHNQINFIKSYKSCPYQDNEVSIYDMYMVLPLSNINQTKAFEVVFTSWQVSFRSIQQAPNVYLPFI